MSKTSHTNRTAQAFTIEDAAGAPGTTWYSLGPNSVNDPGAKLTRKARDPIGPSQQRQYGAIVDVSTAPKYDADLTMSSLKQFIEQASRCALTGPAVFSPTAATSTAITVPAGGALTAGTLVIVKGARTAANNGLKVVDAGSIGTSIVIVGGMAVESFTAADNVTVGVCGRRFASGDLSIASGNIVSAASAFAGLGLASGQTCWLGGPVGSSQAFATAANRGPFRIAQLANGQLTTDKRYGTWVDDPGTGKSIDIYFGRQLRVVPSTHTDYRERMIRVETTYHRLGAGDVPAYGYSTGCAVSQATFTFAEKDFAAMSLEFMGNTEVAPSTSRASGAGAPLREVEKAAYSTVTDMFRGRILKVDPTTGAIGTGLTGYITSVSFQLRNGTSYNGAHGVLGSFETSFGNLELDVKVGAYFTEIDAVSHANGNLPVTADWFMRNNDGAFCLDVPYADITVEGRNFAKGQTIKIDLNVGAVEDVIWGTSWIVSLLPYCPAS